jgi:hypothetical protein
MNDKIPVVSTKKYTDDLFNSLKNKIETEISGIEIDISGLKDTSIQKDSIRESHNGQRQVLTSIVPSVSGKDVTLKAFASDVNSGQKLQDAITIHVSGMLKVHQSGTVITIEDEDVSNQINSISGSLDDETARATNSESGIIEIINTFSGQVEQELNNISGLNSGVAEELANISGDIQSIHEELGEVSGNISEINDEIEDINDNLTEIGDDIVELQSGLQSEEERAKAAEDLKVDKDVAGSGNKVVQDLTIDPATKTAIKTLLSLEDGSKEVYSGVIPVVFEDELQVISDSLNAELQVISDNLDDESLRAKAKESSIESKLYSEIDRATTAERGLNDKINIEISRSTNKDDEINTRLTSEINRAKTAEDTKVDKDIAGGRNKIVQDLTIEPSTKSFVKTLLSLKDGTKEVFSGVIPIVFENELQSAVNTINNEILVISGEIQQSASVEKELAANLAAEEARAKNAESILSGALENEISRATTTESGLSSGLKSEKERAITAESIISGALNNEITRAKAAEDTKVDKNVAGANNKIVQDLTIDPSTKTFVKKLVSLKDGTKEVFSGIIPVVYEYDLLEVKTNLTSGLQAEVSRATASESAISTALTAGLNTKVDKNVAGAGNKIVQDLTIDPFTKTFVKRLVSLENGATEIYSGVIPLVYENEIQTVVSGFNDDIYNIKVDVFELKEEDSKLESGLAAEEARAKNAESILSGALENEISRAIAAESGLSSGLEVEKERATTAESEISGDLITEIARAKAVEDTKVDKDVAGAGNKIVQDLTIDPSTKSFVKTLLSLKDGSRETFSGVIPVVYESELAVVASGLTVTENNLAAEISRATAAESGALADAIAYADSLALETQTWLESVETKADLVSNPGDGTYLCRVREGSDQGVYQWIKGGSSWSYFSDNQDFIDKIANPTENNLPIITYDGELIDSQVSIGTISGWVEDVSTTVSHISGDLSIEITRAETVESDLQSKISGEIERAKAAEDALSVGISSGLAAEINRATARENDLEDLITIADNRAKAAEDTKVDKDIAGTGNKMVQDITIDPSTKTFVKKLLSLQDGSRETFSGVIPIVLESELAVIESGLAAEVSRALLAELGLNSGISAEKNRAMTIENTKVDKNVAGAGNKIVQDLTIDPSTKSFVKTLLSLENGAKEVYSGIIPVVFEDELNAFESDLNSGLEAEINRATTREDEISNALVDEAQRANNRENNLSGAIDNEISRATTREDVISGALSYEVSRAQAAENVFQQEFVLVKYTQSGIKDDFDKLTQDFENLDAEFTSGLAAEIERATTAELELDDKKINVTNISPTRILDGGPLATNYRQVLTSIYASGVENNWGGESVDLVIKSNDVSGLATIPDYNIELVADSGLNIGYSVSSDGYRIMIGADEIKQDYHYQDSVLEDRISNLERLVKEIISGIYNK